MTGAELIRMSTQIAQFFEPYPEADAVAGVVEHLRQFWDPSMRAALLAFHRDGVLRLHPLVEKACTQLAATVP